MGMKAPSFFVIVATVAVAILVLATVSWPVRDPGSCEQRAANVVRPSLDNDLRLRMMEILVWECHCERNLSSEVCRKGLRPPKSIQLL